MAATKRKRIPAELRAKVAPIPFSFADHRAFWLIFMLVPTGVLCFGNAEGYGLVYLLGPPASMLIGAAACTIFPFKPYRGQPFARNLPVDRDDPVVMRLVELFKSSKVRGVLWLAAAKFTSWLLVASFVVAATRHRPLNWRVPPADQIGNVVASAMTSFCALLAEYVGWGMRTWAEREMSRQHDG